MSDAELSILWGDVGTIIGNLGHHRLEWFGLLPEWEIAVCLGTFFPQRYSAHGLRNRWKDGVVRDLRSCDLLASWHVRLGRLGVTHTLLWLITTLTCSPFSALFAIRFFPRPSGRARHKRSAERARPVLDQKGTRCCNRCDRW